MADRGSSPWPAVMLVGLIYGVWLLILGVTTYLVFWRDHSGWWFVLAILLCAFFTPNDDSDRRGSP